MSERIIDPHVHFFNLLDGQYEWLQGSNPPSWPNLETIKRPINAAQLQQTSPFEIIGLVHIEAGFDNKNPINELNWLAQHLHGENYKAVGFACIDSPPEDFNNAINALSHSSLVGIRDITEGADATRLTHPNCLDNLTLLNDCQLMFEAQFNVENLAITEQLIKYCQQLPNLHVVINHAGLPNNLSLWQEGIRRLAHIPNCTIKFSGFELFTAILQAQQQACFDFILQCFGQQRMMFASNFPVCQINSSYQKRWLSNFALCKTHSLWQQLSYKNARHCYQL